MEALCSRPWPAWLLGLCRWRRGKTTHGNLKFTAPLTAITAAVVGVIVNLAVFFAIHVLWPHGAHESFDWPSLLIGLAAGVALFRFKVGVIPVVLACGVIGLELGLFVL
jgi:chromate transporter